MSLDMQVLCRISVVFVSFFLCGIDGQINVQAVVCPESVSYSNARVVAGSSLDYLLDIQQFDNSSKTSISIAVRGKTSDIIFTDVILAAKDVQNRLIGSWKMRDPSLLIESEEKILRISNTSRNQITTILHIDDDSVGTLRIEATIGRNATTMYINCFDIKLISNAVTNTRNTSNNQHSVNTPANTLPVTTVTQTPSPTANVGVNITWTYDSNEITRIKMFIFNMNSGQWAALGLSHDGYMGESHVFICRRLSNDTVVVNRYINPHRHAPPEPAGSEQGGIFIAESQGIENGVVFCQFTLSNFSSTNEGKLTDLAPLSQSTPYYPLIAIGQLDVSNDLKQHNGDSRNSSTQLVLLNRAESFTFHVSSASDDSKTKLLKAHGIIMVFTWIFIVSTGIIVARFFKRSWPEQKMCGKPVWFSAHRLLMSLTSILTLLGFMFVLVYTGGQWMTEDDVKAHAIIGAIVMGLAFLQPFMALFRCEPNSRYRFIFNYLHALVGTSALLLSIVTIFLATTNFKEIFPTNSGWILMTVWVCWLLCICLVLEYLQRSNPSTLTTLNKSYSKNSTEDDQEILSSSSHSNQKYEQLKIFLFVAHICMAAGISIALVVSIAKFD